MKLYLTKKQALENYPLTEEELNDLIETNQVDAVLVADNGDKRLALYDDDLAAYIAERDITPEKFNHLRGNLLGMTEAGLKHGVSSSTISRWVNQGVLDVKGQDGLKKLVDEADVAYLTKLGRAKKMRPGKKPFS
jgi:hypothetical protein